MSPGFLSQCPQSALPVIEVYKGGITEEGSKLGKRIVALAVFLAVLLMAAAPGLAFPDEFGKVVFAAETAAEKNTDDEHDSSDLDEGEFDYEFSAQELEDVLTPDSFLYFFKRLMENVKVLFTFNSRKKADLLGRL